MGDFLLVVSGAWVMDLRWCEITRSLDRQSNNLAGSLERADWIVLCRGKSSWRVLSVLLCEKGDLMLAEVSMLQMMLSSRLLCTL